MADPFDEATLRSLVPSVIGVLVRRGADFAAAEDAVQDALVEAVRTWPDQPPDDPKGWLVTVAWRKFLDVQRSETSRRSREERLEGTGEFVDGQALAPEGTFVRYDGEGRPPVTDGPFAETKDLIAGWMVIDVDTQQRAVELAGELSAAPGAGGKPIHEWLELRPFYGVSPTITE